ncbi:acid phosphatase, putative [Aspergillus fumigatus A1163]|jgi:5'/3'-nucleotidase SurE|uniref:Acid phosphatase, putative n=2 Tax=Aspergillus fumigatus TaxID=746128 RepID=Q4WK54_ASPFU|nr:acid phosphatase, putative [Aspergillus fumigatus Af293]EAL88078.1 acid phosphatase, putative [Aspergillus fumigatus Af293]EDP55710.1 acid phosphatase, putative [Aspergillus fumigatus A1163]
MHILVSYPALFLYHRAQYPLAHGDWRVPKRNETQYSCDPFSQVVNDDGPPSRRLSPYIRPFVDALQAAGHQVSVAIPARSRSWIGKAHIIEAALEATYVPPDAFQEDGTWDEAYETPDEDESKLEWVVITNGTPASCTQLGLFNLFADRGPIDLVISGPNHGRNASTIYNLSSGTVGGALEAAICGKRGIAISFGSKDEQPIEVIRAAARLAVRVVNHLYQNWDERVELYNLNVPMRADVETRPVLYTRTLPYYWPKGCLYAEVTQANGHSAPGLTNGNSNHSDETDAKLCNGTTTKAVNGFGGSHLKKRNFAWSAELSEMKKALQASEKGTDAHTVLNGSTRLASSIIFRPRDGTSRLQEADCPIQRYSPYRKLLACFWSGWTLGA